MQLYQGAPPRPQHQEARGSPGDQFKSECRRCAKPILMTRKQFGWVPMNFDCYVHRCMSRKKTKWLKRATRYNQGGKFGNRRKPRGRMS